MCPLPPGPLQGRCHDVHIRINEAALELDASPTAVSAECPATLIRRGDISLLVTMALPLTHLRQRMLEDLQIRNYSPHTVDAYLRSVAQFAKHFRTSPDRLGAEHIRTYQLHLLHQQVSESVFIQTVCALRFFYETTLG